MFNTNLDERLPYSQSNANINMSANVDQSGNAHIKIFDGSRQTLLKFWTDQRVTVEKYNGTNWSSSGDILGNADLTDTIADLKTEANKGISARRIVQCDANTLNTPFKAGLTNGASGTAFICMSSSSFGTILYIISGSDKMYMLCKTNGAWGNWIAK